VVTVAVHAEVAILFVASGLIGVLYYGSLFRRRSSFLFVLIVAPILVRHRTHPDVRGFVQGAYAAAIGTILGASVLLGKIAIGDWLTGLIAVASLLVLFRWKVSNPLLVAATAIVGIVAFPILKPDWVFVK